MSHTLNGANTTAQFFQGDFPGAATFDRLDKFVVHTTETLGWPAYLGKAPPHRPGGSAPNATYHPRKRQIRQHFNNNRSARALVDGNRDNVFQLEVVCYSEKAKGDPLGGLWVGDLSDQHYEDIARICVQLHEELGLPLENTVTWHDGRATFFDDVRLSLAKYDAYRGILGHVHVPENTHWDPGGFRASRLMAAIEGTEDMTPAQEAKLDDLINRVRLLQQRTIVNDEGESIEIDLAVERLLKLVRREFTPEP
jgi:hypothetical protein